MLIWGETTAPSSDALNLQVGNCPDSEAPSLEGGGGRTKRRGAGASEAEGQGVADEMRREKGSVSVWLRCFSATQAKGSQGKCTTRYA